MRTFARHVAALLAVGFVIAYASIALAQNVEVGRSVEIFWFPPSGDVAFYEVQYNAFGSCAFPNTSWQPVDRGPDGRNIDPNVGVPVSDRHSPTWPLKKSWTFPSGTKWFVAMRVRARAPGPNPGWGQPGGAAGPWSQTPCIRVNGDDRAPSAVNVFVTVPGQDGGSLPPLPPPPVVIQPPGS